MATLTLGRHVFPEVTFTGGPEDLEGMIDSYREPLRSYLRQHNGWIALGGTLHVRGGCVEPSWHSIARVRPTLKRLYDLEASDVCFAQDGLGNQFVLRAGRVWRLAAETGRWQDAGVDLDGFFTAALADPDRWLGRHHLRGLHLAPGQLALAYPPLCAAEARAGVAMKAVAADEVIAFHGHLAAQLKDLPAGAAIRFKVTD